MKIKTDFSEKSEQLFQNKIASEWMSSFEAARFLGTTPNAIRIMICRGRLRSFKLGKRHRLHISDLRRLLWKGAYGD